MSHLVLAFALAAVLQASSIIAPEAQARRSEILEKAESLFKVPYVPAAGLQLSATQEEDLLSPPDRVIYRHGLDYVVILTFATDGSVAKITLMPEQLLYSSSWIEVPAATELSIQETGWFLDSAQQLQPIGRQLPENVCSVSGKNNYCFSTYTDALVFMFREDRRGTGSEKQWGTVPRLMSVSFKRQLLGRVTEQRKAGSDLLVKIEGQWYRLSAGGDSMPGIGSLLRVETFGCAGNERVCQASRASQ